MFKWILWTLTCVFFLLSALVTCNIVHPSAAVIQFFYSLACFRMAWLATPK